jgi:hypothetical protein
MSETVIVAAGLVRHLRKGIRTQFGFAAERLAVCLLEFDEDPAKELERSLQIFNAAHELYSRLKAIGDQPSANIDIDVASSAVLVLEALECQYNAELIRLQEADIRLQQIGQSGRVSDADNEELRALEDLVMVVKRHVQRQGADKTELFPVLPVPQLRTHGRRRTSTLTGSRPRR